MKRIRFRSRTTRMMIVTATLLALLVTVFLQQTINAEPSAQSDVDKIWQRAQEIGTYEYNTTILQTTWPTARLENVGLSSKQDQLYIEGQSNRAEDSMQMKLWSQGGSIRMGQDAIEIKIEDDKALGRVGESEWEEVEDFTELFAPDNDLLTYLVAAKNVTNAGSDTRAGVSFTRYTFDVDGLAFAEHMRDEMEEEMRRKGELPAGMNIDLIAQYVDMIGTGDLWVDSEGLPLRQVMNVEFPPERGAMEWYEAKIETDFSNWAEDPAASAFFGLPHLISQVDWQGTAFSFSLVSAMAGLMFLLVLYRREKKWYAAFAISTILAMVIGPMMQVHQAYAFSTLQQARVVDYETEQAEQQAQDELEAEIEQNRKPFDPNVSPLEQGQAKTVAQAILDDGSVTPQEQAAAEKVLNAPVGENLADLRALASGADEEEPDDDNDGLTNGQEAFFGSNPNQADSDGDGLDDGAEVYYLGTDPTSNDTDGDTINDGTEVRGFNHNNKQWYLDPIQPDTNKDGRLDTVECPNGNCADTDGDGTPDAFDFDDDNDGVPDKVDGSATKVIGNLNSGLSDKSFNFKLSQFQSNKPLLVDVELRPTNPEHLWYTLNVLDWPSNDKEGQVQRVFDDAFGASGKEANGDLKLVPMLEIEIPYKYAHAANLPVKASFNGTITKETPLEAWLDQAKVDAYAMSVRKKDNDGNLLIYVPLNLIQDSVGDSPVAFGARIYYQPNSTDFGNTQKMRLAWLVQAKVDQCRAPEGAAEDYCENQNNWISRESVIHSYYDDWFVTALSVREEHGVKAGVAFENPNYAGQNPNYEKNLWALANGLQDSFLAGRREVNVDEIKRRFDKDSNAGVSETQRWKIPQQALQVKTYDLTDQGQLAQLPMSHTKTIFAQHFSGTAVGEVVNLLFAREERYRTTSLDGGTDVAQISDNSLTLSLNPNVVKEEVLATMNWTPYRHEGASSWKPVDIQDYWDELGDNFEAMYPYQGSQEQQEQNAGKVYLAKNLYLALYQGGSALVEQGGTALNYSFKVPDSTIAEDGDEEPFEVGVNDILGSIDSLRGSVTELRFAESTGASGAALGGSVLSGLSYLAAFGVLELGNEQDAALGAVSALISNLPDKATSSKKGPLAAGAIVGVGVLATFGLKDAQSKVLEGVLKAVEVGANVKAVVSAAKSTVQAVKSTVEMAKQVAKATSVTAVIGLVIGAATSVGLFLYSAISGGLEFGSLAFNQAVATLVATIIVAVIMFAIAAIPIVGQIIVAIIGLIDAIIIGLCKLFGVDDSDSEIVRDYVCGGISGLLVKLVQFFIYSNQPLADLQAENRMRPTNFEQNLVDPSKGFAAGNQMTVGADVLTDLYGNGPNSWMSAVYAWQFADEFLLDSAFKYKIQPDQSNLSVSKGQTNWSAEGFNLIDFAVGGKRGTIRQQVSSNISLPQPGINVVHDAFLTEGYAIPVQECFVVPIPPLFVTVVPVCHLDQTKKDTLHIDLSQMTTYDIFPATLDDFYILTDRGNGGYALAWDDSFPVLMDADGDGLRSRAKGGNDPNDSTPDTDGDGLSDFWEVEHGYDPNQADGDNDGLNDYWEAFYATDPHDPDTDYDGLNDKEELDGNLVGYALTANGDPLRTLVISDPLQRDKDADLIIDLVERHYDWNPNVPNSDDVLTVESKIHNLNSNVRLPNYAGPGDTISYDVSAENHLISRYIRGLLQIDFPVADQNSTLEQAVVLTPKEKKKIHGQVSVSTNLVESQRISLTTEINGTAVRTNTADFETEAKNLLNNAVVYYKFDHDDGPPYKNEKSNLSGQFTCNQGEWCPRSTPGKVNGALFNRETTTSWASGSIVPHDFTASLWVNPTSQQVSAFDDDGTNILLSMGRRFGTDIFLNQEQKINVAFWGDTNISECRNLNLDEVGLRRLVQDEWNHVAVTYEVGTLAIYVNGTLDKSFDTPTSWSSCLRNSLPLSSGGSISSGISSHLIGFDELQIYPNSLSASQISTLYNYHASWASGYQSHNVTVDADNPTVRLALDITHIANQDVVMAIEAADLTSNVEKVEYRINNGSWQQATRNEEVWTFTYQPSGEGEQTIDVRATDSVGNVGQSNKSFTVDGTAPTASLNDTFTQGVLSLDRDTMTLYGDMTDNSSGKASLYVDLIDHAGNSINAPQLATFIDDVEPPSSNSSSRAQVATLESLFTEDTAVRLSGVSRSSVAWGDYDSDGDLDILLTGQDSNRVGVSKIYRNDAGIFNDIGAGLPGVSYSSVAWGDYDSDGDLDILLTGIVRFQGAISKIYRNDSGMFNDIGAGLPGVDQSSVAWGDYDSDGDLDVLLTGSGISNIYRNDAGTFNNIGAGLLGVRESSVSWGDYDNDGDLDIILTGRDVNTVNPISKIYRNDAGIFNDIGAGLPGVSNSSVAWGDYDNDGDLDIILSGTWFSKIYHNDAGTFSDIGASLLRFNSPSVAWGDYDSDGDLDVLLTGRSISKIYRNDTGRFDTGTFTDIGLDLPGFENSSVAWGDYDNDDNLDILFTGSFTSKVFHNNFVMEEEVTIEDDWDWRVDYQLPISTLNGQYTVQLEAADEVGNTTTSSAVIGVDGTAPQADVTMNNREPIAQGSTIKGTATDIPYPTNPMLHLHFEEATGTTTFIDGSTTHYRATCTACPTAGTTGKYGQAASFSNDSLSIAKTEQIGQETTTNTIDSLKNDFTVMAWVKANNTSGTQQILSSATTTSNNGFAFGLAGNGLRFTTHGVKTYNTSSVTLNAGQWYHLAAVMDNENNVTFYVDGVVKETISHNAPAQANEDDNFLIGSQNGNSEFFNGTLDEVVVYGNALTYDQIHAIANPVISAITSAEIGFRGALNPNDRNNISWKHESTITWSPLSLAQGTFSTWSYQLPASLNGPHQIYLRLTDEKEQTATSPAVWTGYIGTSNSRKALMAQEDVDLGAAGLPEVSITTDEITSQNFDEFGFIQFSGMLTGTVNMLEVKLDDGEWQPTLVPTNTQAWQTDLYSGSNEAFDGQEVTLSARASNESGETAEVSKTVFADATPPAPFTSTLSYLNSEGVTQVITPGITIDDMSQPMLTVEWSASSDGSGVADYLVEWVEHISDTESVLASEVVTDGLSASFTAGEAQKLSVRVTGRDGAGNEQTETMGPFYVDYATTPTLVLWDEWAEPYRNWTDNACNLIGTDYRIDDSSNALAALSEEQKFYTTWNEDGLRLAWAGSDWNRDGDLFIYFDSKEGGTERAFNPYPETSDNTVILLPARQEVAADQRSSLTARSLRQVATTNQMAADYMIWVQNSDFAILMVWDGEEWRPSNEEWPNVFDEENNDWQYAFDANHETPTADIFVPFEQLGISDPTTASLSMVTLASENDGLNLWSTMPAGNNVNSERVVESGTDGIQRFILTKRYEWPTLADGICPSGVAPVANSRTPQRTGDALQFTGADIRAAISTNPGGIGYSVLGDNLTGAQDKLFANLTDWNALQNELCEANPEDESCERAPETEGASNIDFNAQEGLANKTDVEHDLLGDKEDITYTIQLFNRGSQPASGVMVDVATWGPVILPDGEYKEDDFGQFYTLEIDVGTLAAGERRTISFTGQTDFAFDPDNNEGWATIDVIVYDDSGSLDSNQIDWLYVDHEIDRVAPDYIEIQSPVGIIGSGENTISGFVFDQSAVPTLTMEIEDPAGQVSTVTCLDETPRDKQWSCTFDAGEATEGDELKVRLKATDSHGQEGNWFDWQTFIVDGSAPTISLDSDSQSLLSNRLMGENEGRLQGQLADNRLVSGVEVCTTDEQCEAASIVIDTQTIPTTTYRYDDEPAKAIAIGAGTVCESGNELVRSIMVTDSFTIADLDVGLNLDHSYRNDLDVYLKSPAGTEAKLISYNPAAENLDVLLDDASAILARFDQEVHNTAAPYYENQRGAYNLLKRFNGEDAVGNWVLTICDYYPDSDDGAYNRSSLFFTAEAQAENTSATWQYQLPMTDEMAHEEQSLTIYALDSVGNRSNTPLALNFTIDNVGPVITPTLMPTEFDGLSGLQFAGEASDESGIQSLQLSILTPNGELVGAQVYPNYPGFPFRTEVTRPEQPYQFFLPLMIGGPKRQLSWNYTDTTHFTQAGTYTLWIEAEDNAGNLTVVGSYELKVLETR